MAVMLLQTSGCGTISAGGADAGGAVYAMGDLKVHVKDLPGNLQTAIVKGGRELGLVAVSGVGDATAGKYAFRNARGDSIVITYTRQTMSVCEMSIRVGRMGDEGLSRQVNRAIQRHL